MNDGNKNSKDVNTEKGITLDLSLTLDEYLAQLPEEDRSSFESEYSRVHEEFIQTAHCEPEKTGFTLDLTKSFEENFAQLSPEEQHTNAKIQR